MGKENITEINSDYFWELIEEMKECCGQDMEWSAQWIMTRLCKLPPEQVLQFHIRRRQINMAFGRLPA